jgi:hypothetical protein
MNKLLKFSKWGMAFIIIAALVFVASCGDEGDPEPEPIVPPGAITYTPTTVAVGSAGTIDPSAFTGDSPTFSIVDAGDAADFVTIDASTGKLSVAAESTTGTYSVEVKAMNSAGSSSGTAEITIGINTDFDPTGKSYIWQYYMNMDAPWTMTGLDGDIAKLPIPSVDIPTGWPAGWPALDPNDWNEQTLFPYLALGAVADLLFQVPGDIGCGALTPEEKGDTLVFKVEDDLSLTTTCTLNDATGSSALMGISSISYADGEYSWALTLYSQIEIVYVIDNPTAETFTDPLDPAGPRQFPAIRGTVEQFTTPTDVTDEAGILTSLAVKKVEVILEVIE